MPRCVFSLSDSKYDLMFCKLIFQYFLRMYFNFLISYIDVNDYLIVLFCDLVLLPVAVGLNSCTFVFFGMEESEIINISVYRKVVFLKLNAFYLANSKNNKFLLHSTVAAQNFFY